MSLAVQGAHEAAQSESTRLMGLDQKLKLQRRVTDDLMSTIRILSRLNLRAAAAMRSAADSARDMIASGRGSAFNAGVNQLDAIADLVGPAGITPSELQSILGMDVGFVPGEDDSVQNVAEALRQLEADLSGFPIPRC